METICNILQLEYSGAQWGMNAISLQPFLPTIGHIDELFMSHSAAPAVLARIPVKTGLRTLNRQGVKDTCLGGRSQFVRCMSKFVRSTVAKL